jgi:uncharacterized protein YggE
MSKKKLFGLVGFLATLTLALAACAQMGTPATLAAGEASPVRGGGGVIPTNGQYYTEGLVAVGTGTASAEPEVARVTFGVDLRGDDPAEIVKEAAEKIDRATAAAREVGDVEEEFQTVSYNLWVENIYAPETGAPTGEVIYHASHYVQATLRDLDQVGDLLASVVEAGANTISSVEFSVENPDALIEQAREEALKDAGTRAEAMASGLDIEVGKPILVMETSGGYPGPYPVLVELGRGGAGPEAAAPSISPGSFSVSVSVQVVYEIS